MKVKKAKIIRFLEILAISEPAYINEFSRYIHYMWRLFFYGCVILLVAELLDTRDKKKRDIKTIIFPVLIFLTIIISTLAHRGDIKSSIVRLITYSYCVILISLCAIKGQMNEVVRITRDILFVLVLLNLFSIVLFPDGMYQRVKLDNSVDSRYWFLGFKNGIGKYSVFLITLSAAYRYIEKNRINTFFFVISAVSSITTAVLIGSGSGLVGALLSTVLCILVSFQNVKIIKKLRMKHLALFVLFLFLTIVVSNILLNNVYVQYFITKFLGKSVTLTGRIYIWESVLSIIKDNFWIGTGLLSGNQYAEMIGVTVHATDAHNYFLEFFMEGGIICFIIFVLFLLEIVMTLDKNRNDLFSVNLSVGLFTLMIIFLVENCNNSFLWLFYGICLNCNKISVGKRYVIGGDRVVKIYSLFPDAKRYCL